jgi:uncharacterized protein YdgA (DUF945 family)
MVAKDALVMVVVAVVLIAAVLGTVWYFGRESERQYEKDMKQMEHTEKVIGVAETSPASTPNSKRRTSNILVRFPRN